jgi:hypothetical protein
MRQAIVLFIWLLTLAVLAAVIVAVWWWILETILIPLPYSDPEPPSSHAVRFHM